MASRLFKRKSIEALLLEAYQTEEGFRRSLGRLNLVLLGVGAIVGVGVYVLTGPVAAQYAGPAIILSVLLSGLACIFAALCYAELAAMIPVAGSAYTYAYATLGQLCAWIIGWDLILEYLFGASLVAVGWSGYVVSFLKDFGIEIPAALSNAPIAFTPGHGWSATGAYINLPAMFILAVMCTLVVVGIRESARVNNLIVFIKVGVLLLFVIFGARYITPKNWTPFIPENAGHFGVFGWSGILRGAAVMFLAYVGFDCVSTLSQEAKNPQRDMPVGIIGSLAVATVIYILVALVLTGMVNYTQLNVPDSIAVALNAAGPALFWLRPFVKIGAIAGISSVILVLMLGQPRIFFSMANDGFLPPAFAKLHPRFRTPYITSIVCGVLSIIVAGFVPLGILGELVSVGTLLAFVIVCLGVLVLRKTHPEQHRPFKTPFVVPVSLLGAGIAFAQMCALPIDTWIRLLVWMGIGLVIYFVYGTKYSRVVHMSRVIQARKNNSNGEGCAAS